MDIEKKMELVRRVGEEIVTEDELRGLFETKAHPVAYDGFEPSGLAPIHFGVLRALNIQDMTEAGVKFKLYLADWFGWINNKMGGDLDILKAAGDYFIEVWKAGGVDPKKVDIVWSSDFADDREYWKKVMLVAKNTTVQRTTRALTIMGRKEGELKETAQFFYPMMQVADVFHIGADICQMGVDQRRAAMLAREVGPKLGWWKPVSVSHHMLMGLQGAKQPEGFDDDARFDAQISSKMSKSRPETAIFIHDSAAEIKAKIAKAYAPEKIVEGNPLMEYNRHIIFRKLGCLKIERPQKFGGDLDVDSYDELERIYRDGKLHPMDLKNATAAALDEVIEPIRSHFETNKKARVLYEFVKSAKVTR